MYIALQLEIPSLQVNELQFNVTLFTTRGQATVVITCTRKIVG